MQPEAADNTLGIVQIEEYAMSGKEPFIFVESLEKLKQSIIAETSRINNTANTSGMAEALFANYIKQILDVYVPVISPLASHHGDTLYRARKCVGEKPFNDMKYLYNPPSASGRAYSSDDTQILYASSSMQTCLSEINPKIGDLINIAQFNYSKLADGHFWFVGQLSSFHKSNEPSHYLADKLPVHRPAYFPIKAQQSWAFMDALLNEIFSQLSSEADGYALNRFIINQISEVSPKEKDFHGVVFMSVKDPPGTNFAIFGDAIKQLEPRIINLVRIADIDSYGFIAYKLLKNAKPDNGSIVWPEYEHTWD